MKTIPKLVIEYPPSRQRDVLIRSPHRREEGAKADRQAERLGGFEVDHQLELGRLFDRNVTGLGAPQHLDDLEGELSPHLVKPRVVGGEAALLRRLGPLVDRT